MSKADADRQVVRTLVGLKLRLLRNGLRRSPSRAAVFVLGSMAALAVAVVLGGWLAGLHGRPGGSDAAVVLTAVVTVVWGFSPLVLFSTDESMDPHRLALLPLRPGPMLRGLALSALLGPGPLVSLVVLSGAAAAAVTNAASLAAALVAVPLVLVTLVALSRAVATGNARMLSSRRGRDLAVFGGLLAALGVQGSNFAFQELVVHSAGRGGPDLKALAPLASVLRWIPPAAGMAAIHSAGAGSYAPMVLQLASTAGVLVLLMYWWRSALHGLMVNGDSSTLDVGRVVRTARRTGGGRLGGLLPSGRSGVAMQRQLLYLRREPRVRVALAGCIAVSLVPVVVLSVQGHANDYIMMFTGYLICLQAPNLFGADGSAFWLIVSVTATARDARAELLGRVYALLCWGVPVTALAGAALAFFSNGWSALPGALGLTWGLFGCGIATGVVMSVLFPLTLPADGNPMRTAAPGQTGTVLVNGCGSLIATGLVFLPFGIAAAVLGAEGGPLWVLLPLGPGYSFVVCAVAVRLAGRRLLRRLPEVLEAVSRR